MTSDVRQIDLAALNSLTKYPSIPTYHRLDGSNGRLAEEALPFPAGPVLATEKVDGTNARVIILPGGNYLLGSREELLFYRTDVIGNPSMGIVAALKSVAERLAAADADDAVVVYFGEVYGGKVTAGSKQYTGTQAVGFRLFDAIVLPDYAARLTMPAAVIAAWRDGGGQPFVGEADL